MARLTENFGLLAIEPGDDPFQQGYKFFAADRDLIDMLLRLGMGAHSHDGAIVSLSDGPEDPPFLALDSSPGSGGTIPAGVRLWYRVSLVSQAMNLETPAGPSIFIDTPDPLGEPGQPGLAWGSSGGTLQPGVYSYVLSAWVDAETNETRAGDTAAVQIPVGTVTNRVVITFPALPSGAEGFNIYRRKPGGVNYDYVASVDMTGATPPIDFVDDGLEEDCDRIAPRRNTTFSTNAITVAFPGATPDVPEGFTWKIYRTAVPDDWTSSLVAHVTNETVPGVIDTEWLDVGSETATGSPLTFVPNIQSPDPIQLTDAAHVQGELPAGRVSAFPLSQTFVFPGPCEPETGTLQWECAFPNVKVLAVKCRLGLGSVPAADPVRAQVISHTAASGDTELFAGPHPEVPVSENAGDWVEPDDGFDLERGDTITVDLTQAGGGATPTDFDLAVTVYMVAYGFDPDTSFTPTAGVELF